jgi:predicted DsbA family dithiol-disulfide isomerase
VKVEIWSDVVCPWCYIGKRRFEAALARFPHREQVEVVWRSFELDPHAESVRAAGEGPDHADLLAAKYAMSRAQAEAAPVGDRDTLARLAAEAGLDAADVEKVLDTDEHAEAVRADEAEARALGITGVPFFVVDRSYGVSGAQPADQLLAVLERAWSERAPLTLVGGAGSGTDEACGPDGCPV